MGQRQEPRERTAGIIQTGLDKLNQVHRISIKLSTYIVTNTPLHVINEDMSEFEMSFDMAI